MKAVLTRRAGLCAVGACAGLFLVGLAACAPEGHHEALPDLEHEAEAGGHGAEIDAQPLEGEAEEVHGPAASSFVVEGLLGDVLTMPVQGFTGPGGKPFKVAMRSPEIGHYPCTSCHIRPIGTKSVVLAQMHVQRPEAAAAMHIDCYACHDPGNPLGLRLDCAECHAREGLRDLMPSSSAHLTIRLGHPSGHYRNCFTCHAPENPGLLALQDGNLVTLDEAYRKCAECHFMQAESWAGGGHGKRLAGWQSERVILSCTGCHNPHSPKFPVRRPVTFPKIARRGVER
ncbi:MAG TPA: cytochrome c3 family protein [Longimicrobiales bacterium]|nr:cytochrome c3 family protein [Longimicrobiales bacterium]